MAITRTSTRVRPFLHTFCTALRRAGGVPRWRVAVLCGLVYICVAGPLCRRGLAARRLTRRHAMLFPTLCLSLSATSAPPPPPLQQTRAGRSPRTRPWPRASRPRAPTLRTCCSGCSPTSTAACPRPSRHRWRRTGHTRATPRETAGSATTPWCVRARACCVVWVLQPRRVCRPALPCQ